MKLLKRLTLPTVALLALSLCGGCGKPLESGEGEVEGQRGRDSRALMLQKQQREEADQKLRDGYVKVGQALAMAHLAVQDKLPGNAGLSAVPLAVDAPAPAEGEAAAPAPAEGEAAAPAPAEGEVAAPAPAEGEAAASAPAEGEAAAPAPAEGEAAAPAEGAAPAPAEGEAAAPVEGGEHQVTAADEGLVEPAGPVMPELKAQGTIANELLGQAYALLDEAKAGMAGLVNGEYDGVLDAAAKDRIISLQELVAVTENLILTGAYLQPMNEDVVELIKQAREAAEGPAEGEAAPAAEGAPVEGEAAPAAEGAPAEGEAAPAAEGAPVEGEAAPAAAGEHGAAAPAADQAAPAAPASKDAPEGEGNPVSH